MVLQMLADIVSKNGNLLLNFPPRPDGTLDDDELKILAEMAAWMPINGEAIFGTRPWKVFGEGPHGVKGGGFNEGRLKYTAEDIRFTTRGKTLYALALGWPTDGKLKVRSLATPAGKVEGVSMLGSKERLRWTQEGDALVVEVPKVKPCDHVYVLKIAGRDLKPAPIPPPSPAPPIQPGADGRIVLPAIKADLEGPTPNYDEGKDNIGWWGSSDDYVSWAFEVVRPGRYVVEITYSCANGREGSQFVVAVGEQALTGTSTPTGSWSDHQTVKLGTITIDKAGPATLTVKPKAPPEWKVIGLRSVTLTPEAP
jgi:alpha-L-fucosidase